MGKRQVYVLLGSGFALTLAYFDGLLSLLKSPSSVASPFDLLASIAITLLVGLGVYAALQLAVGLLRISGDPFRRNVLVAACLAALFSLYCAVSLTELENEIRNAAAIGPWRPLVNGVFLLWITFMPAAATYLFGSRFREKAWVMRVVVAEAIALPFQVGFITAGLWLYENDVVAKWGLAVILAAAPLALFVFLAPRIRRRGPWALSALTAVTLLSPIPVYKPAEDTAPPTPRGISSDDTPQHVLLIVVDTLRRDVLSCYGGEKIDTEHMDALAEDGTVFLNAYSSAPWTLTSMTSMLSGLSPLTHKVLAVADIVPDSIDTLGDRFGAAGFYTGAIGTNPVLIDSSCNLARSFDEYRWYPKTIPWAAGLGTKILQKLTVDNSSYHPSDGDLTDRAIMWYDQNRSKDTFLWLHYFSPHVPYIPLRRFLPDRTPPENLDYQLSRFDITLVGIGARARTEEGQEWVRTLYRAEVAYVDEQIGRLMAALKEAGLYDSMTIIITSDHGEEFWEHGDFEHGHTMYNELLRVPLIVKEVNQGQHGEVTARVSTGSLAPTLLDMAGVSYSRDNFDYTSLKDFLSGQEGEGEVVPMIIAGNIYYGPKECVIFDTHKYIRQMQSGREKLYNLERDPEERMDIALVDEETLERGRNLLAEHHAASVGMRKRLGIAGHERSDFDEATRRLLESVGYL